MARGSSQTRVDEKGRLKVPVGLMRDLEEKVFFVTSQDGERAEIWPLSAWKKKEVLLAKRFSPSSRARQRFERTTSYYGAEVEMDAQGRVLLPQPLREDANLMAEVVVIGRLGQPDPENPEAELDRFLEVTNHDRMRMQVKTDKLTDADFDELAAAGL